MLRRHREQRGITLEDISKLTKISATLLAALERGDCSRWPAGIYSRAYVRDYAQAIGLDRDETAAQFAECFCETAFPEGTPERKQEAKPAPGDARPPVDRTSAPLRLTIGDEPREHRREIARRSAAVVLDVLLSIGIAMVLNATIDAGFWMTLAIVSLCCHAAGIVRGRAHAIDALAHLTARRPAPDPAPATTDSAFAEAA